MNHYFRLAALLAGLLLVGCTGETGEDMLAAAADSNAKRLGMMYSQFQLQNVESRWTGPEDRQQLEEFIRKQNPDNLAIVGIDPNDLESLFISGRDEQPFKIRWGVKSASRGPSQPVVFEEEGVDGKYIVGFTGFLEKEVDQAEYDRLWSGAADNGEGLVP